MSVRVMKKLTVLAPGRDADKLVRRLMRLRCAEICSVPLGELPDGGRWMRYDADVARADAERRVTDVTAAIATLDRYTVKPKPWNRRPIVVTAEEFRESGRCEAARKTVEEVLRIRDAQTATRNEYNRVEALHRTLAPWVDYDVPLGEAGTALCAAWPGTLPPKTALSAVEDALASAHAAVEEIGRDGDNLYVAILLLGEDEDTVTRALSPLGFARTAFKGLLTPGTAAENRWACEKQLGILENDLQACTDRLAKLSELSPELEVLYDLEMTTLTAARQKQKLAATEQCVLLTAWVPADRESRVFAALDRLPCAYEVADPAPHEEPPVLLENNGFASNFEWVVGMYAYPKYGTFDPTFIMSIFYFFIFGIMFADVGYGALLLLGGFLIPKLFRMKGTMKRMLNMFGYCGISCILLGFVFGGWFGDLPYALMTSFLGYESVEAAKEAFPIFNGLVVTLGGEAIALNPLENPMAFLVISLAVGAIHLVAGMAVKFVLLCKQGEVFAAIFDIGAYWVLFAGIGLLFVNPLVGGIVAGVGALAIVATHGRNQKNVVMKFLMGLKGLYDLISYASDLLSYCRILALGLAAGVVGQVINLLATMGGPTPGGFILLVFVMLFGHTLNMAINILGSFVHTSRLQYLEFFGKFYEDGGVPFDPALPSDRYSTAEQDVTE